MICYSLCRISSWIRVHQPAAALGMAAAKLTGKRFCRSGWWPPGLVGTEALPGAYAMPLIGAMISVQAEESGEKVLPVHGVSPRMLFT